MIHITEKQTCCGCAACVQCCPKQCITLEEDREGFLYPHVDPDTCIDCHLCEKVCPCLNPPEKIAPTAVLAAKNRDEEERMESSSGGLFIALAKHTLARGGVVFGAVFDEHWEVKHTCADTIAGVLPMMGSKYLQSRIGSSFREAEKFLKAGRDVLFVGTPCQITGLHNFLRKDYPNLLSVDILCHGVPSPGVWRRYLQESTRREAKSPILTRIKFRSKREYGWSNYCFVISGQPAPGKDETVLHSGRRGRDAYLRGFLSNLYLRPSCYHCLCKNGVSHSDLTIADFWGINRLMPDFHDEKGVGLVLISSEKGQQTIDSLPLETRPSSLDKVRPLNGGFREEVKIPPQRDLFYQAFQEGKPLQETIGRLLHVPLYRRISRKIKQIIRKRSKH